MNRARKFSFSLESENSPTSSPEFNNPRLFSICRIYKKTVDTYN